MSKFISSAVNYSETDVLKTKILSIILESYNEQILLNDSVNNNVNLDADSKYIIPNNDNKYYMLIINKSDITPSNINNKYKICYFFTNKMNTDFYDFYVEIDNNKTNFAKKNYLFEGYLYNNNTSFLITDILSIDSIIINCDYSLRYSMINKIIENQNLNNLNGYLNINIHSVFELQPHSDIERSNELFNIFKHNFVFKDEINSIKYINEKCLRKTQQNILNKYVTENQVKKISKTKYIDVYNVQNIESNDYEGILYIKTIKDSKKLFELLNNTEYILAKCLFNEKFKKWQVIEESN